MSPFLVRRARRPTAGGRSAAVRGGFDLEGRVDSAIRRRFEESKRPVPIGCGKGSGLSLLLDMIGPCWSRGRSDPRRSRRPRARGPASRNVFIAVRRQSLSTRRRGRRNDRRHRSLDQRSISGQRTAATRRANLSDGMIPVDGRERVAVRAKRARDAATVRLGRCALIAR